jgi:hypothetical protein
VVYPPLADHTEKIKSKTKQHNPVFLYTTTWGSHPHASPEGPGTTPSEKCHGWSTTGPLGAAMRLKALRQPPNESPGPMNPRQKKRMANINDLPSPQVCYHKHPSPDSGKSWRTARYGTLQRAPNSTGPHYPQPKLTTCTSRTHKDHLFLKPIHNKNFPQTSLHTCSRHLMVSLGAGSPNTEMHTPNRGEQKA